MSRRKDARMVNMRDHVRETGLVPREFDLLLGKLTELLLEHGAVLLPGFGVLRVVTTPARDIKNSACGHVRVPETRWVAFRSDIALRRHMGGA